MSMFDKIKNTIPLVNEDEKIKEGKKIIKEIMGTKLKGNQYFFSKMTQVGVSTTQLWPTWYKVKNEVTSELKNGFLELDDIPSRIDQLVFANRSKKTIKEEEKINQSLINEGITDFDFKCSVQVSSREVWNKHFIDGGYSKSSRGIYSDGYCYVQEDKVTIKLFDMKEHISGEKIIDYKDINAIDYQKYNNNDPYSSAMIIINITGLKPINIHKINENNYKQLKQSWNTFKNTYNEENPAENQTISNTDELMKYAELYEKGLLTKEEFNKKKKELL